MAHVYRVQRRRVRPVGEVMANGKYKFNEPDLMDKSHAGIITGPGYDILCDDCYAKIPSLAELLRQHKTAEDARHEVKKLKED